MSVEINNIQTLLCSFGNVEIKNLPTNLDIFNGIILKEPVSKIEEIIYNSLINEKYSINLLYLNNISLSLTSNKNNIDILIEYIYKGFLKATQYIYLSISKKIENNNFDNLSFFDSYFTYIKNYNKNCKKIISYMNIFNYLKNNDNYYIFNDLATYAFYINVVEQSYLINEKYLLNSLVETDSITKLSIYDILIKKFESNLEHLYNIYRFQHIFVCLIQKNKSFDSKFVINNDICFYFYNKKILSIQNCKLICEVIHNKIIEYSNINKSFDVSKDEKENKLKYICDIIKLCSLMSDKIYFNKQYLEYLEQRLFNHKTISIEMSLVDYIPKSVNMINDFKISIYLKDLFEKKIQLSIQNEKYSDLDKSSVDIYSSFFKILNKYTWQHSNCISDLLEVNRLNEPLQISLLLDTFTAYYERCFTSIHKKRKLLYNYNTSTTVLEISLDKVYDIKMTLLQATVYIYLNDNGKSSIEKISKSLNIEYLKLKYVINSLIKTKLILCSIEDDCHILYLNKNWKYKDTKLSIVNSVNEIKKYLINKEKEKKQTESELLNVKLTSEIINNLKIPLSIDELKTKLDDEYDIKNIHKCIENLLKSDTIKYLEIDVGLNISYKYTLNNIMDELDSSDNSINSSDEDEKKDTVDVNS